MKSGEPGLRLRRRLRITTCPQALRASFAGEFKLVSPSREYLVPAPPGRDYDALTLMMPGIGIAGNLAMVAYRRGASRKASKPLRVRSSQPPVSEMTETERKKVQVASAAR